MINHHYKCIFIHVPKCAGSSIEVAIDGKDWWGVGEPRITKCKKHLSASQSKVQYKKYWEEYTKFAFVRNPYSLQVSWYFFGQMDKVMPFKEYVKNKKVNRASRYSHMPLDKKWSAIIPDILTSYEYIANDGKIELDFVGRFEKLQGDFNLICDRIGAPRKKLPHIHKSKNKHYTEYYDEETRDIVTQRYAKDIEYFGYQFGK